MLWIFIKRDRRTLRGTEDGFNTFKQVVKEMVVDYFPEKYRNANVEVSTVHKLNESYEGLCIQKQDSNIQIRLNLNQMYEKYRNGEHLQDLLEDIRDVLENEDREFDLNQARITIMQKSIFSLKSVRLREEKMC